MKLKFKNILCAAAILSLAACTDNISFENSPSADVTEETVFFVTPYVQSSSRADDVLGSVDPLDPDFLVPYAPYHLSEAHYIDALIFAVYEVKNDGSMEICPEYAKFIKPVGNVSPGIGQNVVQMSAENWPYQIKLLLDPNKNYRVAFWAQSSATLAYDTHDLSDIRVDYERVSNNDELRDAFSGVIAVAGKPGTYSVLLDRALAQVNVGVKGWDYEAAGYLKPDEVTYTQSKVVVSGLSNSFNALHQTTNPGILLDDDGKPKKVTLNYSRIPAFHHLSEKQWNNLSYYPYSNEEFLYVNLPDENDEFDDVILPYAGWEQYYNFRKYYRDDFTAGKRPPTETFKYLSMCYIFAPTAGSTVDSFTFYMTDEDNNGIGETFTLNNVPIQRNWRTNLICNDLFITNIQFHVYVVPTFCGDLNRIDNVWQNSGDRFNEADGWIWAGGDPNSNFTHGPSDEEREEYDYPEGSWPDDYYPVVYEIFGDWFQKPTVENGLTSSGKISLTHDSTWHAEFEVTDYDTKDDITEFHFYIGARQYDRMRGYIFPIEPDSYYTTPEGDIIYMCQKAPMKPIEEYQFVLKPGKYAVTFTPAEDDHLPTVKISKVK